MGCRISKELRQARPRMHLVNQLVAKCRIGNPNIDSSNVVLVPREDFLRMGKLTKYEDCSDTHVTVEELTKDSIVLFVSHRWQDADANKPDDQANTQYVLIVSFLRSAAGADITHIWVDYSCITQDKVNSLGMFLKQLDNIQTAVFLSDVVLVIPRIVYASDSLECGYTDLEEINDRGWCLFEAVTAEVAQCKILVAFLAGLLTTVKFFEVGGGTRPGSALSLKSLRKRVNRRGFVIDRSYRFVVESAVSSLRAEEDFTEELGRNTVLQNWESARDPLQLWKKLQEMAHSDGFAKPAVSLTLSIAYGPGKEIADMLPDFSYDSDRSIVTNLLANVAGFVCGRFKDIRPKTESEISVLSMNRSGDWDLDLGDENLFPADLDKILIKISVSEEYRLNLDENYLGYNGVNVLVRGGFLQKITNLRFSSNGLGTAGAFSLGESLKIPTNALTILNLDGNEIGAAGGQALADGLRQNATLTELSLKGNGIGNDGAQALAEALKHNATISKLNLYFNQIGDAGAQALADGLRHNATLTELILWDNQIDDAGAQALADGLRHNATLTELNLRSNWDMTDKGMAAIREAWGSTRNGSTGGLLL